MDDLFLLDRGDGEQFNITPDQSNIAEIPETQACPSQKRKSFRDFDVEKALSKSVITAGYEKQSNGGFKSISVRAEKRHRKAERAKSKGDNWFGMPASELTDERRSDLELIRMRNALDPKIHYKSTDREALPKFFQFGRVLDGPADRYSRIPRRQRQRTIVDELLADTEFRSRSKKKALLLRAKAAQTRHGAFRKASYPKKRKRT